ncbi:MAG: hypothetical protein V1934_07415 [Methanobacteriota archaeon]
MRRWDGKGVGGFAEELPALLVVLVAISLFVASAAQAYASYGSRQSAIRDRERVESFAVQLCAESELTWNGKLAMFEIASLSDSNASDTFHSRYNSSKMGFGYKATFSDLSGADAWIFSSDLEYTGGEKVRIAKACNLVDKGGFVKPALLTVEAWGLGR